MRETGKRLTAYAAIILGTVLIVIGNLMSGSKDETATITPVSNPATISKNVTAAKEKSNKKSKPIATPALKTTAPKSTVKWLKASKTDQYSDTVTDQYKVVLTSQEEFDTGIPIVSSTNLYVLDFKTGQGNPNVSSAYNTRWTRGSPPGSPLYVYKTMVFEHDVLTYTLKLKLENNSPQETLLITVEEGSKTCGENDSNVHDEAARWAERMKRRLK